MNTSKLRNLLTTKFNYVTFASYSTLGLAFQNHKFGILVVPAIAGIWWSFQQWKKENFVRVLWLNSLVFFGLVWSWLLFMEPSGWSPLQGFKAKLLVIFVWIVVTLIFSIPLYYAVKIWKKLQQRQKLTFSNSLLLFTSLWILQELARSYLFALIMLGDGSPLAPHWNFGVLGITLTSVPVSLPLSSTIGMYGLSCVAILAGVTLYAIVNKLKQRNTLILILILVHVLGLILSNTYVNPAQKKITISALNTSSAIIDYEKYSIDTQNSADLIVLPEYSEIFTAYGEKTDLEIQKKFIDKATNESTLIISSRDYQDSGKSSINKLLAYDNSGGIHSIQEKTFIIPGGEYIPYWAEIPFKVIAKNLLANYNVTRKIQTGSVMETPIVTEHGVIGAYACSGVISPPLYRSMAKDGAQVLTNSASLTIFDGSEAYHQQTEGFAKFHASANQKPFIQATKMGKAYIINTKGEITQRSETAEDKYLIESVGLSNSKTPYTRFGELTIYLAILYLVWFYWAKRTIKTVKK